MTARVLVSTKQLSRRQWLEWRRRGLGGSDAAAVLGLDPYRSPMAVYLDKTGWTSDDDDGGSEAMRWGQLLEEPVARYFAEQTGLRVHRRHAILQDPDRPWMIVNVDRTVHPGPDLLEVKTHGGYAAAWKDLDDPDGVPDHVHLQAQHQLSVTGWGRCHLAVLVDGRRYRHVVVERDDELIGMLQAAEATFWENHVQAGVPPAADGHPATTAALKRMHPEGDGGTVDLTDVTVELPVELGGRLSAEELLVLRGDAADTEQTAVAVKALVDNHVRQLLGAAEVGTVDGRPAVTLRTRRETVVAAHVRPATRVLRYPKRE